jgi:hypothetical protein
MKKEDLFIDINLEALKNRATTYEDSVLKDSYYKLLNGFKSQKDIEETCDNLKSVGISDEVVDYYKELAEIRIGF